MAECGGPCSVGSGSSAFLHESASGQSTLEIALGLPSFSLSPLTLSFFLSLASPATHTKRSCSWWCLCVGYTEEKKEVREWVAGNVVGSSASPCPPRSPHSSNFPQPFTLSPFHPISFPTPSRLITLTGLRYFTFISPRARLRLPLQMILPALCGCGTSAGPSDSPRLAIVGWGPAPETDGSI